MRNEQLASKVAQALGCATALCVSYTSHASESREQTTFNRDPLETILVTAQRREERQIDVPMSVAAISGETLEQRGIRTINDLSHTVPSLSVRETGPGQQLITIRGIGNDRGSSSLVGIYLDDAPVSSIPFSQIDLRVTDLQRVEVLRGPQGTIWGEGSVGGTIRFITNQPELDRASGSIRASIAGTDDADSLTTQIEAMVNMPLVENVFGLRVAGMYEDASGWIDQPEASSTDINDYELKNVRATAAWHPTDGLDISLSSTIHRVDGGGQSLVNVLPADRSQFRNPVHPTLGTFLRDDYEVHNLTIRVDLGSAQLVSATSYMDKEAVNANTNNWQPAPAGTPMLSISAEPRYTARMFSQEVRLLSQGESAWNWTIGAFYRDANDRVAQALDVASGSTILFEDFLLDSINDSQSWAVFGDANYAVTDRLRLGAGVRYFTDDRSNIDVAAAGATQSGSFDSFDPRVYATFALTDSVNLYANVATGLRSGGFNSVSASQAGAPKQFDPERVRSYETGVKSLLFDGALRADVSVFFSQYDDIQVLGLIPSSVTAVTSNAGEAEIKGIEYEFEWAPTQSLSLALSGNVIDTEITKVDAVNTSHQVGDPIDYVPKYGYALSATRTFDLSGSDRQFAVSVDYSFQDGSTETSRSTGLLVPVAKSESLSFLNASLRLEHQSWTFELFAQNILDERDPLTPTLFGYAGQARPRTYGLRASYKP